MSEEKTEEPTEQKIRESREKGQVPQRKNVLEAFTLCLAAGFIFFNWKSFVAGFDGLFGLSFRELEQPLFNKRVKLRVAVFDALEFGFMLTGLLAGFGFVFHMFINKFNFSPKSLEPKFEKLNPVTGLKNLFSKSTLYNFLRLLIYFLLVCVIFYAIVYYYFEEIVEASMCGINCIAEVFYVIFLLTVFSILLLLIILAAFDFKIQDAIFISQSKMTKDEVKREHKGNEGDPLIKSTRRQLAQEDAQMPSLREITHAVYSSGYLVALVYYEGQAPFVVLKCKQAGVQRILTQMRAHSVACVNLPRVARDFYVQSQIGTYLDKRSAPGMIKILEASRSV